MEEPLFKNRLFIDEIKASMDAKIFLDHIITGFFNSDYQSNKLYYMILEASNLIKSLNTKSLFIIDEAGNFKPQMHKYIREFRDRTEDHSGLIISGPNSFYTDLKKLESSNKYGISEMMSRIDYWVELKKPAKHEMRSICQVNGIIDEEMIDKFLQKSPHLRRLGKLIEDHLKLDLKKKNAESAKAV